MDRALRATKAKARDGLSDRLRMRVMLSGKDSKRLSTLEIRSRPPDLRAVTTKDESVDPEHLERVRKFKAEHEASKAKLQELQRLVDEKKITDEMIKLEKQKLWDAKCKQKREDISMKVGESWDVARQIFSGPQKEPFEDEMSLVSVMVLVGAFADLYFSPKYQWPWSYHNGGSWPTILWQFTLASMKMKKPELSRKVVERSAPSLHPNHKWCNRGTASSNLRKSRLDLSSLQASCIVKKYLLRTQIKEAMPSC
ncbi:hypothetical protein ACET3Z_000702 [Daucus carota]